MYSSRHSEGSLNSTLQHRCAAPWSHYPAGNTNTHSCIMLRLCISLRCVGTLIRLPRPVLTQPRSPLSPLLSAHSIDFTHGPQFIDFNGEAQYRCKVSLSRSLALSLSPSFSLCLSLSLSGSLSLSLLLSLCLSLTLSLSLSRSLCFSFSLSYSRFKFIGMPTVHLQFQITK